uniref:Uncharacterized protein n=1 Tax=Anguilla anguilla TaxID=7936 RepID=A0A0E9RN91_ANGAN
MYFPRFVIIIIISYENLSSRECDPAGQEGAFLSQKVLFRRPAAFCELS